MKSQQKIITIIVAITIIISGLSLVFLTKTSEKDDEPSLVPSNIWSFQNIKEQPITAMVLNITNQQWQAKAAAAITPAYLNRAQSTPIIFNDGIEPREITIPHESKSVDEFGGNVEAATANIAQTYWQKAEIVIIPDTYEHVLWAVPIASFLSAPILVNPSTATIQALGTKCAVFIGETNPDLNLETTVQIRNLKDAWGFQLDLYYTQKQKCDYIIITNPKDTESPLDPNIKFPYLSLATAPLAAYRNALIVTGDYTTNRTQTDKIAQGMKPDEKTYTALKPYFQKVKQDSYTTEKFMLDSGHEPKYMAIVGGNYAVPDYIFDYHITYFYWSAKLDYIFSPSPYGDIANILEYEDYPYQELEIGRILGHSLLDTSLQLTKTFFYRDFLTDGRYDTNLPDGWENNAAVIEGHRVNQPNAGGPPMTNDQPFYPAGEIQDIFTGAGLESTYYIPRNVTDYTDNNPPLNEIFRQAANSSMILVNAHGGSPGYDTLLEIGMDANTNTEYTYSLDGIGAAEISLAPSVVYVIGCDTGSTAIDMDKNDYLTLGFIHSGAVAYIAPETYQTICYWEESPEGPEGLQCIHFFENLVKGDSTIGNALIEAKWKAYKAWENTSSKQDDVGPVTLKLYGDPAFKPVITNPPSRGYGNLEFVEEQENEINNNPDLNAKFTRGANTRQTTKTDGELESLSLLWDESVTLTGEVEIANLTIKNFGRLIVKDAELTINGWLEISEYGSLFMINSNVTIAPPAMDEDTSIISLTGHAIVRSFDSNLRVNPPPTPLAVPFIISEGGTTFLFRNGDLNMRLPAIPRDPEDNFRIMDYVLGTAGVVVIGGNSIWKIESSLLNVNMNYETINNKTTLLSSWYWGTIQGDVLLELNDVYVNFYSGSKLIEAIKGRLEVINTLMIGSILTGGVTELNILNSTINGNLLLSEQSISTVTESKILGEIQNGRWSEADIIPKSKLEVSNTEISGSLFCGAEATSKLYHTSIEQGALLLENSSSEFYEVDISGVIVQEDYGKSRFLNSSMSSFFLKDDSQTNFENPHDTVEAITLYYNYTGSIYMKDSRLKRLTVYSGNDINLNLINSSITRVTPDSNSSFNLELFYSAIDEILDYGYDNSYLFTIRKSDIPTPPAQMTTESTLNYPVFVHISLNGQPISTAVEVHDEDGLVAQGITNESGVVRFDLFNSVYTDEQTLTSDKYLIKTSYMGYSEEREVVLNKSLDVLFIWQDDKPPVISNIDFKPKAWNTNWRVTVQATVNDDTFAVLENISIVYTTNDGKNWKEVPMQKVSENQYEGIIPGQELGTDVKFYIATNDKAGNLQKSQIEEYSVGFETVILFYVLIVVLIIITIFFAKLRFSSWRTRKRYYHKFQKQPSVLSIESHEDMDN
jgi:hypothetical protein